MKKIPVPWLVALLLVVTTLATSVIAVGTRIDLRNARQGAEPLEAAVDTAKAARIRAEERLDSLKLAHDSASIAAAVEVAKADTARRRAAAGHASASRIARELAQGNVAIIEQLDIMDSNAARLTVSYDSLRVEYSRLDFRYDSLEVFADSALATSKTETLTQEKRGDYWEGVAVDALSRRDFDLFAWIPKGPVRKIAKGLACGGMGLGVALLADAAGGEDSSGTVAKVGGVGAAGTCVVATIVF